jgi:hypothetical protein
MREQVQARLQALKAEWATGQTKLRELELQQLRLREVLLRVRGAIQVLEEVLGQGQPGGPAPPQDARTAEQEPSQAMDPAKEGQPGTDGGGPP